MSVPLPTFIKIMTVASAMAGLTAGLAVTAGPASARQLKSPVSDDLISVSVVSRTNAWAVGISHDSAGNEQTLTEHWNGRTWRIVPSPNPGGPGVDNDLDSVAATSASNAWAVGAFFNGTNWQTLILHWNGRAWRRVKSPNPGGLANRNILEGVSATSTAAWIAGYYDTSTGARTLILRWNGRSWRRVASPQPGGAAGGALLRAVSTVSSTSAWAVGESFSVSAAKTLVVHWNGRAWHQVSSGNVGSSVNELDGVSARPRSAAWAVGNWSNGPGTRTLAERWNGRSWHAVPTPSPGGPSAFTTFDAVATASRTLAWAVGTYPNAGAFQPLLERWNGTTWRRAAIPALPAGTKGGLLFGVAIAPRGRAWVVGEYFTGTASFTLVLRWNGRSWQRVSSPNR